MITWKNMEMKVLEEAIPNCNIFQEMYTYGGSFIPDAETADMMDLEYFYNRSGRKLSSPLVCRIQDNNNYVTTLARMLLSKYGIKWGQLFERYSELATANLLNNIVITKDRSANTSHTSQTEGERVDDLLQVRTPQLSTVKMLSGGHSDSYLSRSSDDLTKSGSLIRADSGTTSGEETHTGTKNIVTSHTGAESGSESQNGSNSKIDEHTGTVTDATTHGGTETDTTAHTGTIVDSGSESSLKNLSTEHIGTIDDITAVNENAISAVQHSGTVGDSKSGSLAQSVYGFNALNTTDASPYQSDATSETSTKTYNNTDTTTNTNNNSTTNTKTFNNTDIATDTATLASGNIRTLDNQDAFTKTVNLTDSTTHTFNNTDSVSETSEASITSTKTVTGSDTVTETPDFEDTSIITHGKTTTETYNNLIDSRDVESSIASSRFYNDEASTESKTGTESTSNTGTVTNNETVTEADTIVDTTTEQGYNYRSLVDEYKKLFNSAEMLDFLEIVYTDVDALLTIPVFA